jgi:hypothetical protein
VIPRRVCVVVSSRACEQNNDGVNGPSSRSLTPPARSGPRRDLQPSHLATRPAQPTPHPPLMFMGAYRRRASGKVSQGGERGRKERSDATTCARARAFFHLFLPPVCFRFCVCASACRDGVRGRPPRPPPPAPRPGVRTNHPGLDRPGLIAMVAPLAARPGRSRWTLTLSRSWCRSLLCIGGGHEKVPALPTPQTAATPCCGSTHSGPWVLVYGLGGEWEGSRAWCGRRRPSRSCLAARSSSPAVALAAPTQQPGAPPPPPPAPALFLTRRRPRPPPPPGLFRPSVLAQ